MEATTTTNQTDLTMPAQPQREHEWLQKMVGEWTYQTEAMMGPDQPVETFNGTETVRSLGGLWVVAEGEGDPSSSCPGTTLMTLGYDPQKGYVGTWVGSMMNCLWVYEGELDEAQQKLTLSAEGPAMAGPGTAQYRDVVEFKSDDQRLLTSHLLGEDGQWHQFATTTYQRQR